MPGPLRAALALVDIPINRNSGSARAQMRCTTESWTAEVRAKRESKRAGAAGHFGKAGFQSAPTWCNVVYTLEVG